MKNLMSIEEAKKMVGTEFTYVFIDGDEIPAYVKVFDPEVHGLTCYSLEPVTKQGYKFPPEESDMPDGTFCVIGGSVAEFGVEHMLRQLTEIKITGRWASNNYLGNFAGCAF